MTFQVSCILFEDLIVWLELKFLKNVYFVQWRQRSNTQVFRHSLEYDALFHGRSAKKIVELYDGRNNIDFIYQGNINSLPETI